MVYSSGHEEPTPTGAFGDYMWISKVIIDAEIDSCMDAKMRTEMALNFGLTNPPTIQPGHCPMSDPESRTPRERVIFAVMTGRERRSTETDDHGGVDTYQRARRRWFQIKGPESPSSAFGLVGQTMNVERLMPPADLGTFKLVCIFETGERFTRSKGSTTTSKSTLSQRVLACRVCDAGSILIPSPDASRSAGGL